MDVVTVKMLFTQVRMFERNEGLWSLHVDLHFVFKCSPL